jgi:hypothetical protein
MMCLVAGHHVAFLPLIHGVAETPQTCEDVIAHVTPVCDTPYGQSAGCGNELYLPFS